MKYLFVLITSISSSFLFAQSYFTTGGVRLGTENGLTIQQRIFKHTTIQGIVLSGFKANDLSTGIMIQQHFPLLFKNFNILTGAGFQSKKVGSDELEMAQYSGVSIIGGIELSIGRFNVAWDYKPAIYLNATRAFQSESGISIRYIFISNRDIRKWERKRKRRKRKNEGFDWFGLKKDK